MTTKEYLGQIIRLEKLMQNKLYEIERLKTLATNISASVSDGVNVQRTRNMDKMGSAVVSFTDIENQIAENVNGYLIKRSTIINQIDSMDKQDYYDILTLKYVQGKRMVDIEKDMNYSPTQTKRILHKALASFENKFGRLYAEI